MNWNVIFETFKSTEHFVNCFQCFVNVRKDKDSNKICSQGHFDSLRDFFPIPIWMSCSFCAQFQSQNLIWSSWSLKNSQMFGNAAHGRLISMSVTQHLWTQISRIRKTNKHLHGFENFTWNLRQFQIEFRCWHLITTNVLWTPISNIWFNPFLNVSNPTVLWARRQMKNKEHENKAMAISYFETIVEEFHGSIFTLFSPFFSIWKLFYDHWP